MNKPSKVLCVVDPAADQPHALARAAWMCRNSGATLELLICHYDEYLSGERYFDSPSLEVARNRILDGFRQRLEELAQPHRNAGVDVAVQVLWDHPLHEGIVRYAARSNADLVVKDTRYHSSIARALLSNTDWQLIRNCASPLWLVKPAPVADRPVFIAAIDPMNDHDKPAALDDQIVVFGKMLAATCGGELHAFHAYDPQTAFAAASVNAYLPVSLPYDEIVGQLRDQHDRRFHEITGYHELRDENTHLIAGRTEHELPELARQLDASVALMGAVARNRWQRLFIGATAERTLDRLPCDLLIVKPDWFRIPAEILHPKQQAA